MSSLKSSHSSSDNTSDETVALINSENKMSTKVVPVASEPSKIVDQAAGQGAGLQRQIGLIGTIAILVGTIIGSGIFASPASVSSQMNSPGGSLVVWAGCGVIAMLAALSWMELGCMFPNKGGGEYAYIHAAFGPLPAFLFAYVNVLVTRPASLTIISLTCGDYLMRAFNVQNSRWVLFQGFLRRNITEFYR